MKKTIKVEFFHSDIMKILKIKKIKNYSVSRKKQEVYFRNATLK